MISIYYNYCLNFGEVMSEKSYWAEETQLPKFTRLERDVKVDVVIIGGGVTGRKDRPRRGVPSGGP
jgi:hypothetical protein